MGNPPVPRANNQKPAMTPMEKAIVDFAARLVSCNDPQVRDAAQRFRAEVARISRQA